MMYLCGRLIFSIEKVGSTLDEGCACIFKALGSNPTGLIDAAITSSYDGFIFSTLRRL